jgi:peptide/nickel transport system permease protein
VIANERIGGTRPVPALARGIRALGGVLVRTARLGWPVWVLASLAVLAVVGPVVAPHDPYLFDVPNSLQAPSFGHPFGTDQFGRDLLSRMLVGSRSLVTIAGLATVVTLAIGVVWGLLAAYFGGLRDELLMRAVDITISVPEMLIAIVILTALGTSRVNLIVAIAIVFAPFVSRVVRSAALVVMAQEYVSAAKTAGEKTWYIVFREVLPNILPVLVIEAAMRFGFVVLLVASLGFLGLGVQPPTPDWGLIVSESRNYMRGAPWLVIFPAVGIALLVVASHTLADRVEAVRTLPIIRASRMRALAGIRTSGAEDNRAD